jgi:hypothetical protein
MALNNQNIHGADELHRLNEGNIFGRILCNKKATKINSWPLGSSGRRFRCALPVPSL